MARHGRGRGAYRRLGARRGQRCVPLHAIPRRGLAVTYAVRDSEYDGKAIRKGQILGLTENKVTVVTDSKEDCVRALLGQVTGAGCVTVFYGSDVSEEEAQAMERQMAQQLGTGTDLVMVSGGQPVYTYLIAME